MTILYPEDYVAPGPVDNSINKEEAAKIKEAIKSTAVEPWDYSSIINELQKTFNYTNDQLHVLVKEVDLELHPVEEDNP